MRGGVDVLRLMQETSHVVSQFRDNELERANSLAKLDKVDSGVMSFTRCLRLHVSQAEYGRPRRAARALWRL